MDKEREPQETSAADEKKKRFVRLPYRRWRRTRLMQTALGTVFILFCIENIWLFAKYRSFFEVSSIVKTSYYEKVDDSAVMQGALKGYVAGLEDPYSQYLTEKEYKAYETREAGQRGVIGISVLPTEDGNIEVQEIEKDSEAEKAGLQKGDIITAVEEMPIAQIGYQAAIEYIGSIVDEPISLNIQRGTQMLTLEIMRRVEEIITAQGQILDGNIGYIHILNFRDNTPDQFFALYDAFLEKGVSGLVFDVRDNGGGLTDSTEKILDPLLPEGDTVLCEYRSGKADVLMRSDAQECSLPMVVLVNGNTASAAEIFAACLHDFKQAKLVGTKTFGKGIMQATQPVAGGALTLTIASVRTSAGESYHGQGLMPDIEVDMEETPDYAAPDPEKDAQLARALEILA